MMTTNKQGMNKEELWDEINTYAENIVRETIIKRDNCPFTPNILKETIQIITTELYSSNNFENTTRNAFIIEVLGHGENAPDLRPFGKISEKQKAQIIYLAHLEAEVREKIDHISIEIRELVDFTSNRTTYVIPKDFDFDGNVKIYPRRSNPFRRFTPSDTATVNFFANPKYSIYREIEINGSVTNAITSDVEEFAEVYTIALLWSPIIEVVAENKDDRQDEDFAFNEIMRQFNDD